MTNWNFKLFIGLSFIYLGLVSAMSFGNEKTNDLSDDGLMYFDYNLNPDDLELIEQNLESNSESSEINNDYKKAFGEGFERRAFEGFGKRAFEGFGKRAFGRFGKRAFEGFGKRAFEGFGKRAFEGFGKRAVLTK